MRIAVISDIHADITALDSVVKHMESQNVDKIIFLGDLVVNGSQPKEVLVRMKQLSPTIWLKGNTDEWLIGQSLKGKNEQQKEEAIQFVKEQLSGEDITLLLSKADQETMVVEGFKIMCVHGSPWSNQEAIGIMTSAEKLQDLFQTLSADILLCGHSHLAYSAAYNGKKVINCGSISLPLDGDPRSSYVILDIAKGIFNYSNHRVPYNMHD